mgnify:CR=1 FL=1|jgi:hypothetical protein
MPTINVEDNIRRIQLNIDKMSQEVFKLHGMLQTFQGFKKGGLTEINLPNQEPIEEELESIQEKPE